MLAGIWLHEPDRPPVELVRYASDAAGRLVQCASLHSGQLRYAYDDAHRIVGWGDASHTHVQVHYGSDDRVCEVRTSGGELYSGRFVYHPDRRATEVWTIGQERDGTPRLADRCEYRYNADGLVTHERDALGHESITEWDRYHHVTARVDALGRRTIYQHTDTGMLERIRFADGRSARFAHDPHGRLTRLTDAAGRTRGVEYDTAGQVVARTEGTLRWKYRRDVRGRLLEETGPDATTQHHHWDEQHRRCGHTAANGGRTVWRQDRLGRIDWLTDAVGATTTYGYDPAATPRVGAHTRPAQVTRADGSTEHYRHDAEGLLHTYTDSAGHVQHWQWGAFDLLAVHIDAAGHRTSYHWGSEGRLAKLVNAAGQRWHWEYDAAGRCIEQTDYAGRRTRWQRDAVGRVMRRAAPDGATLDYSWDVADRLVAVHACGAGGEDVLHLSYHHDPHDRLIYARVWQLGADASLLQSELRRVYDAAGRLQEEVHVDDTGRARRIAWRHDATGRVVARDAALGETAYGFDALGLLARWQSAHGDLQLQRDPLGRELERQGFEPSADLGFHVGWPAARTTAPGFTLQHRHDKLGHLVLQQQLGGRPDARAAMQRRYHWQADRLVGVDDALFGRVRWQLDARDQIRETQFEPEYASARNLGTGLREHPDSSAVAPPSVRREARRQQFSYDAVGNLSHQDGHALRYQGDTVTEHGAMRYAVDG